MNSKLACKYGVVLGHYDSRGGTIFVEIKEPTPRNVKKAMDFYNRDFFGYDEVEDVAYNAGVGRECDRIADKLIRGGEDPATSDFLYVGRIHYRRGTWPKQSADLEEDGFVLEEVKENEDHPAWVGGPQPPYVHGKYRDQGEGPEYNSPEWHEANAPYRAWNERWARWLRTPPYPVFNLEYVKVGVLTFPGFEDEPWVSSMNEEEFAARNERVKLKLEQWEQEKLVLAHKAALTDFGKSAVEIPRWDDDAFGFLVIGGPK